MSRENKKVKNKTFRKWVWIMIGAGILGFLSGMGSALLGNVMEDISFSPESFAWPLEIASLVLFALVNIAAIAISTYYYKTYKVKADNWDGEDEAVIEEIEDKLDFALIPTVIITQCDYFLLALCAYIALHYGVELKDLGLICMTFIAVAILFVSIFTFVAIQKKVVDLAKKLNPEKRGDIFDMKFHKVWEASCDEAEKAKIYKSGFEAYKKGMTACQVMWVLSLLGMSSFDTGLFPSFCITVIMLVMSVTYFKECRKK